MARGRMINTTIALDPEFNGLSLEAQLMFLRTVPHLDRDGLVIGQPAALWATVAPLMPDLMPAMQSIIEEWKTAGLVIVIAMKIGPVLHFPAFRRNQVGFRYDKEPPSRYTLPDNYEHTADGIRQTSGKHPDDCRQSSGKHPDDCRPEVEVEIEVEEEAEEEGEHVDAASAPAAASPPSPPPTAKAHVLRLDAKRRLKRFDSPFLVAARFDANGFIPPGTGRNAPEVYYERFGYFDDEARLTAAHEDDLARACPDLDRLRDVIVAYDRNSYHRKRNVQLILDWYRNGIPQRGKHGTAKQNGAAPTSPATSIGGSGPEDDIPFDEERTRAAMAETQRRVAARLAAKTGRAEARV